MQNQLELLKQLQYIDNTIAKIEKSTLEFPIKMKQLEKEFERRKQKLEKEKAALEEIQGERRKKEQRLRLETERMQKSQDKLLLVKTNKEYQAVLKEIDDVKQTNSDLETEILIHMETTDKLAQEIKEQEIHYRTWLKEFERQTMILQSEVEKSGEELENQRRLRMEVVGKIDPDVIKRYEMLREKRQGLAVVSIRDGLCQGCNMNIPPQKFLEIRKNDNTIMDCPFCSRILYFDENMP
ncbi:MAG: C4-type zinc ribbon domain-containing protein [Pseudomonadota bacterium]